MPLVWKGVREGSEMKRSNEKHLFDQILPFSIGSLFKTGLEASDDIGRLRANMRSSTVLDNER